MFKKALAVLVFALIVPTAAMAQNFSGTVNHIVIRGGSINDQTLKYSQKSLIVKSLGAMDADNLTLTLTDSGNGYATVVGNLTFTNYNVSLNFSGNLLSPAPGKQYIGDVPVSGSFEVVDSNGNQETNTFSASGNVRIVATKGTSGITKGVLSLKLFPYNEVNSFSGNPIMLSVTIPAVKFSPY